MGQSPFGRLQALPRDGKPVIKWQHRDDAYVQIARGVRQVAKALAARPPDKENPVIGRGGITNGADFHGSERTLNTAVESPMPRVFICHSIRDRDFVEREIIVLLRQHGLEPWYAVDDLQTAAVWDQCILQALEACDWFLIVLSSHSEASEWVRDELHWAIENRPPGRIIPVLIEDCRPWKFHLRLNRIQFVDFRKDREKSRRRLPCSPDCPHGPSPPPSA